MKQKQYNKEFSDDEEEEEYVVEKVIDKRMNRSGKVEVCTVF